MKSGDLLIETNSAVQSKSYLSAKTFLDSPLQVTPHKSLNSSRGVILEPDSLHISEAEILEASSSTVCPAHETTTTTSNSIPSTSQDAKETSKPRKKKRHPKNTCNAIKPKIEIKMAPHKPRKSAPIEYTTDEEDITYDVEDEPEPNPKYVLNMGGY
ncbi:hypothetical protein TNCV_4526791 [Trichonephila clavipes]|nr:hypothetical protein TNCV_4526791 [Trichonephila clavipes]